MENHCKKILITGAAGLIGREICNQLSDRYNIVAVDNNFRYPDFKPTNCTFIQADLIEYISTAHNDFDYIFHMSAINGTSYFYEIPNQLIENNTRGDLAVFEFAKKNIQTKIIYASSSEVVAGTTEFPTSELSDVYIKNIHNPRWSYRISKMLAENYLVNSNLNYLIIRFFNVYGKNSASGHFIKDILDKISTENYKLIGANETRSFCRVEDAVDALINIFENTNGDIINIGSDEEILILDAATIISNCIDKKVDWELLPNALGSSLRRKPCLTKLKSLYPNFNPMRFEQAIKKYFS